MNRFALQTTGQGLEQKHGQDLAQKTDQRQVLDIQQKQLQTLKQEDELFKEYDPQPSLFDEVEPPEPPEIEDLADSEHDVRDVFSSSADGDGAEPELAFRPGTPMPFRITDEWEVIARGRVQNEIDNARRVIVEAVALHLRRHEVQLKQRGDWVTIPAVGNTDNLVALMPTGVSIKYDSMLNVHGPRLKNFLIELPSGDRVALTTLIHPAIREDATAVKLPTMAAVRRAVAQAVAQGMSPEAVRKSPPKLPGFPDWARNEWKRYFGSRAKETKRKQEAPLHAGRDRNDRPTAGGQQKIKPR